MLYKFILLILSSFKIEITPTIIQVLLFLKYFKLYCYDGSCKYNNYNTNLNK